MRRNRLLLLNSRRRYRGLLGELSELLIGDSKRAQDVLNSYLVDVEREVLAEHLDLELVVELEIWLVVELDENA